MYKIAMLNQISERGLKCLRTPDFTISDNEKNPEGVILRSRIMEGSDLNGELLAIARAGAGTNNIPVDKCSEAGIVVFNTPGANANAVKELVVAGMLLSSRKIIDAINWVHGLKGETEIPAGVPALVEREKARFIGPELSGKTICVAGLGAIGVMVANACYSLGMEVYGYDPFMTVDSAWGLSRAVRKAPDLNAILPDCDFVTLHVPLTESTENMFGETFFATLKKGARLLNFSRAEIIAYDSLKMAIENGAVSCYVTDFPNEALLELPNVIAIPHLGASTPESEENCAEMAAKQLKDFLKTGTIVNSVNFPNIMLPPVSKRRLTVIHSNIPHMIGYITGVLSKYHINIDNMINKSKGSFACTVVDVDELPSRADVIADIEKINSVTKVRVL